MFTDHAKIYIRSGKGGDGHVSFRREKYVPNGGPDGGDGGRGGDIIFEVDKGLNTLGDFRHKRKYKAADGEPGGKRLCHGKSADDLVIKVPEGTIIREAESGRIIADLSGDNTRQIILKGGKGGLGNAHFATSTMQVPRYAKPGQDAQELYVELELKVIADAGLVGYPNVGKSTLLSCVSNARPKIANYHFTTLIPNLGVVDLGDGNGFVMADIPGLIEGAGEGVGLGHDFLRHIERTKLLIHVVDVSGSEGRDPVEDIKTINAEMKVFNEKLTELPQIIAGNKIDICASDENPERIRAYCAENGLPCYMISCATGEGIKELLHGAWEILKDMDRSPVVFEPEFDVEAELGRTELPYTVYKESEHVFCVEGPAIEKMLGYTNLDSEKGFLFFQKFLKEQGIEDELIRQGVGDGDTVRLYDLEFEYMK